MKTMLTLVDNIVIAVDPAMSKLLTVVADGVPVDGAIGFQTAASTFAPSVDRFHNFLQAVISLICILVASLLAILIVRFNARRNPVPATFSHNSLIEVVWTTIPVLILVMIAIPSFPLLYTLETRPQTTTDANGDTIPLPPEDWVIVKTYGRQWYWSYIYPDGSDEPVEFDSFMIEDQDIQPGQKRRLSVDYPMVVPAGRYVNLLIGASDVIHSWAMPSFRLKTDAIPGRLNELWFRVDQPGVYYGQCSELCGIRHSFMPIEVRVVPQDQYDQWYLLAKSDIDQANDYLTAVQPLTGDLSDTHLAAITLN